MEHRYRELRKMVVFAALMLCVPTVAVSYDCAPPPSLYPLSLTAIWHDARWVKDLGLTDEQVTQLKEADYLLREKKIQLQAQLSQEELSLEKAIGATPIEETTIVPLARKIADLRGQVYLLEVETTLRIRKLFTTEQLMQLHEQVPAHRHPPEGMGCPQTPKRRSSIFPQ